MSRKFIPMYRVLKNGELAGYAFHKPKGKDKVTIKEEGFTFEHLRNESQFGVKDRRVVVALLTGLGKALAFQEGIAVATVKNTPLHVTHMQHYKDDDYLVLVDYLDKSPPGYIILDYRTKQEEAERVFKEGM